MCNFYDNSGIPQLTFSVCSAMDVQTFPIIQFTWLPVLIPLPSLGDFPLLKTESKHQTHLAVNRVN